jgi:hypothetical protein
LRGPRWRSWATGGWAGPRSTDCRRPRPDVCAAATPDVWAAVALPDPGVRGCRPADLRRSAPRRVAWRPIRKDAVAVLVVVEPDTESASPVVGGVGHVDRRSVPQRRPVLRHRDCRDGQPLAGVPDRHAWVDGLRAYVPVDGLPPQNCPTQGLPNTKAAHTRLPTQERGGSEGSPPADRSIKDTWGWNRSDDVAGADRSRPLIRSSASGVAPVRGAARLGGRRLPCSRPRAARSTRSAPGSPTIRRGPTGTRC